MSGAKQSDGDVNRGLRALGSIVGAFAVTMIWAGPATAATYRICRINSCHVAHGAEAVYDNSANTFALHDTAFGNPPVYVLYKASSSTTTPDNPTRHTFNGGCGNGETRTVSGTGHSYMYCVDDAPPDTCSSWKRVGA